MKTRLRAVLAALLAALSLAFGAAAQDDSAGAPRPKVPTDQDEMEARAFSGTRTHERRRALVRSMPKGALVVLASGKANARADAESHRANRDFLYLTGIDEPGCFVLLSEEKEILYAPPRNRTSEVWNGPHVHASEATAKRYGFDSCRSTQSWKDDLRATLADHPAYVYVGGTLEPKDLGAADDVPIEKASGKIGLLRQVKDEDELALLRRAVEVSCAGMLHLAKGIGHERYEFEAQALFEQACRFYGAQAQGYPSIVGSGQNSCILHYSKNRRRMKDGDLLLVDAGAECGGYSADVTRTYPVSGKFTPEQRRVYDAVLRAQEAGIAECRPGRTVKQVGDASRAVLREAGLLEHLPHGVSHWLGLDVHDAGDYGRKLEPGMVLTVEPGVYIPDKQLGVRIECDILVTNDEPVNLSESAPKTADAMEKIVQRARGARVDLPALPETKPLPSLRKHKGKLY